MRFRPATTDRSETTQVPAHLVPTGPDATPPRDALSARDRSHLDDESTFRNPDDQGRVVISRRARTIGKGRVGGLETPAARPDYVGAPSAQGSIQIHRSRAFGSIVVFIVHPIS